MRHNIFNKLTGGELKIENKSNIAYYYLTIYRLKFRVTLKQGRLTGRSTDNKIVALQSVYDSKEIIIVPNFCNNRRCTFIIYYLFI